MRFSCAAPDCAFACDAPESVATHKRTHGPRHPCDLCRFSTNVSFLISAHKRKVHGVVSSVEVRATCPAPDCGLEAMGKNMAQHVGVHDDPIFFCDAPCRYSTRVLQCFQQHAAEKHGRAVEVRDAIEYRCHVPLCGFLVNSWSSFECHVATCAVPVAGKSPLKCPKCAYLAWSPKGLSMHKSRAHGPSAQTWAAPPAPPIAAAGPPFVCPSRGCGAVSASRVGALNHAELHRGSAPYKCAVAGCGYAAPLARVLDAHGDERHGGAGAGAAAAAAAAASRPPAPPPAPPAPKCAAPPPAPPAPPAPRAPAPRAPAPRAPAATAARASTLHDLAGALREGAASFDEYCAGVLAVFSGAAL